MSDVFLGIVNLSITASWIILAVIVLRFAFRKAPKWINCILWAVVGLRLIMPFSVESVLSLIPSKETISMPSYISIPDINTGIKPVDNTINEYIDTYYYSASEKNFIFRIFCLFSALCGLLVLL